MIFSLNLTAVSKKKNTLLNNKPYTQVLNIDRNAQRFRNRRNIYLKKKKKLVTEALRKTNLDLTT